MWSQGFLHCSPSPRGADSARQRIAETSPGSRDGLWGHHSPLNRDIAASEPEIKSAWGGSNQFLPCLSWQKTKEGFCPAGRICCSHQAAQNHPGWDWQGPRCRVWDFSSVLTHLPGTWVCCERDTQHICCGGEENICWKSGWIGASSSDFFKIAPRSKNSKCTNLQRMMGYFEGYVGSGSQHQGRKSRAFCWISAKTWLGTVICVTLYSPES